MADDDARLSALVGLWASDAAATEAADRRRRQRWLTAQTEESATLLGSLVDLAESGATVSVRIAATAFVGEVRGVGRDFCVVERAGAAPVAVALGALCSVAATGPGGRRPAAAGTGDREPPLDLDLIDMVGLLAADRHRVRLHLVGGQVLAGRLRSVGSDVVVVLTEGPDPAGDPVLVPLRAIEAVAPA